MVARKLIAGAMEAVGVAAGVARHLAWYLSYQVDGTARHRPPARRRAGSRAS
ncbi:MAG: hypothetical protein IRZ21_00775 [Thermoleophilaceae bacterium]|nr:hypothetical protein [Thermoleophilaceae bacterium]